MMVMTPEGSSPPRPSPWKAVTAAVPVAPWEKFTAGTAARAGDGTERASDTASRRSPPQPPHTPRRLMTGDRNEQSVTPHVG